MLVDKRTIRDLLEHLRLRPTIIFVSEPLDADDNSSFTDCNISNL